MHTSHGGLPLLYPAFPFVFFATLVVWSLDRSDDRGRPWFERLARIPATAKGAQIARLGTWIIGMNLMYAATLTLPLVIIRSAFLHHDPFVP